jgi:hypothetical protein
VYGAAILFANLLLRSHWLQLFMVWNEHPDYGPMGGVYLPLISKLGENTFGRDDKTFNFQDDATITYLVRACNYY